MNRKSFVSLMTAVLLGVGIVGFTAVEPTDAAHLAMPSWKICGMCPRGL